MIEHIKLVASVQSDPTRPRITSAVNCAIAACEAERSADLRRAA